jgi:hypothetical protein
VRFQSPGTFCLVEVLRGSDQRFFSMDLPNRNTNTGHSSNAKRRIARQYYTRVKPRVVEGLQP